MIAIVIPNYNGAHHLKECFESLSKQTLKNFRVLLVDNNSTDESVKFTRTNFPEVEIIKLEANTGFAKAVNAGIQYAQQDVKIKHILLLNNDVECDRHFVEELSLGFISDDIGSVACKMINFFNREIIDNAGDFIKRKGSPYARGHAEKDAGQYDKPELIWGACGGAAIYKREVFETIGFFDEDFFAYYEDVDLNFRMQLAGYKCYYNPKAICYHKRGATSKDKIGFETMLCEKNIVAVRLKNYPLKLLLQWSPYFLARRFQRYYFFARDHSIKIALSGIKGYLRGLSEIPKTLRKRGNVQRHIKVSSEYIEKMFR